mmetsp:Transcript_16796/g.48795  ORF Transcript_16796/g.48795 Transcript_16796/m.48795 type:complete len:335 (-) Transcript_16796:136-1140(-)
MPAAEVPPEPTATYSLRHVALARFRHRCYYCGFALTCTMAAAVAFIVFRHRDSSLRSVSFDPSRALKFANFAGAAYCSAKSLGNWTCGPKCVEGVGPEVLVCRGSTTKAYVSTFEGDALVAFEGTKTYWTMFQDLRSFKNTTPWASCSGCFVHTGFLNEWISLQGCIESSLQKAGKRVSLRMTGHSLGGAICTLAMVDLVSSGWKVVEAYTFGSPRVGDAQFSSVFATLFGGSAVYRVTHHMDPVPHVPPEAFNFFHVAPEVFFDGNASEDFIVCPSGEDPRCAGQYDDIPRDFFHIGDHKDYMGVLTCSAGCNPSALLWPGNRPEPVPSEIVV